MRTITLAVRVELQDHALAEVLLRETGKDPRLNAGHVAGLTRAYLNSVLSHIHVGPAPVVKVEPVETEGRGA